MTTRERLQDWHNVSLAIFFLTFFTRKIPLIPSFVNDLLFIIGLITALIRAIILLIQENKHTILYLLIAIICVSLISITAIKML